MTNDENNIHVVYSMPLGFFSFKKRLSYLIFTGAASIKLIFKYWTLINISNLKTTAADSKMLIRYESKQKYKPKLKVNCKHYESSNMSI